MRKDSAITITNDIPTALRSVRSQKPIPDFGYIKWLKLGSLCGAGILIFVGFIYIILIVFSHRIDDNPDFSLDNHHIWHSDQIAVMVKVIDQMLDYQGLALDAHKGFPEARLVAKPAYQRALIDSLRAYSQLNAHIFVAENIPNFEFSFAVQLLTLKADRKHGDRLFAAREAFARYDGMLARNLLPDIQKRGAALQAKSLLLSDWALESEQMLNAAFEAGRGWPMSKRATEAFYYAKGRAFIAHHLLKALAQDYSETINAYNLDPKVEDILQKWDHIASLDPIFIWNGKIDNIFFSSHLPAMSYLNAKIATDMQDMAAQLVPRPGPITQNIPPASTNAPIP